MIVSSGLVHYPNHRDPTNTPLASRFIRSATVFGYHRRPSADAEVAAFALCPNHLRSTSSSQHHASSVGLHSDEACSRNRQGTELPAVLK